MVMHILNWIENEASRGLAEGDARDALTAIKWKIKDEFTTTAQAEQEPVAWQLEGPGGRWLNVHPVQLDELRAAGRNLRPLFAAQPPAAPVGPKSAPGDFSSQKHAESDPSVTLDYPGADTRRPADLVERLECAAKSTTDPVVARDLRDIIRDLREGK